MIKPFAHFYLFLFVNHVCLSLQYIQGGQYIDVYIKHTQAYSLLVPCLLSLKYSFHVAMNTHLSNSLMEKPK